MAKSMMKTKEKRRVKGTVGNIFIGIVITLLIVYTISQFFVLGWGLLTSLKGRYDFESPNSNVLGFPDINGLSKEAFTQLGNYKQVLSKFIINPSGSYYSMGRKIEYETSNNFWNMAFNSLMYIVIAGGMQTIVPCIVAYMCSKYKYAFSKFIVGLVVVLLSVHIIGAGPASVKLLRDLGLYDSFFGQAVQHCTFLGMYCLVFVAYFDGLSDTYTEAAEIDGASQFRVLVSIGLPLAAKMLITIFLLRTVSFWNDYNTPLLYLPSKPTLAYGVYKITQDSTKGMGNVPVRVAGGMVLAIPMLIIFVIFKKQLMGNVTMGGLKE